MSYYLNSENHLDPGPIYVRENGQLHMVSLALDHVRSSLQKPRPFRLFSKGFSVELCVNREDGTAQKEKTDHFTFTYTREGNLRYSAKSLFTLVLSFISDNVDHVDSLMGFPEQIAEKRFSAAEARQKFMEPGAGLRALQKFTEACGSLVLCSLCLRNRYLVISEKPEEIKSFWGLTCLDLSCCKLGDDHKLLEHLTNEALSSVTQLHLKDNCSLDAGVRKMTAPVWVMKGGLGNLTLLDLSCNPEITDAGVGHLFSFRKLNSLAVSGTGLKDVKAVKHKLQTHIGLVHSKVALKESDHSNCKTEAGPIRPSGSGAEDANSGGASESSAVLLQRPVSHGGHAKVSPGRYFWETPVLQRSLQTPTATVETRGCLNPGGEEEQEESF